ncbi:MAG: IS110 family transposase [Hyphomicrobiales bacterium]|nr:MAG: IS110 family transposase [Hyphomicrobiales bacterium]
MAHSINASRCLIPFDQGATLVAVVEMGQASWLVAGLVPGLERQPLKKLPVDQDGLLQLLHRWRLEAVRNGCPIQRIAVAFEAGRDGFWLARWLQARTVEAYVIHASSVPVSREHRRAKTDRLDTELLKRAFVGWLRGEPNHCSMASIPSQEDEDARRPSRERETLVSECTRIVNRIKSNLARLGIRGFKVTLRRAAERLETLRTPEGTAVPVNSIAEMKRAFARLESLKQQIKEIENVRGAHLEQSSDTDRGTMVRQLRQVVGVGVESADMLVQEVFLRPLRDRKAVARYAGLTGAPDESGQKRRERGLAKGGNARVRRAMIQLAWGHLVHQPNGPLAVWYRKRTADARGGTRKTMVVALARKLLITLWRLATSGVVPEGLALRAA